MIRLETPHGWLLITHQDHARLAGTFAEHWGNTRFAAPEPREAIIEAVRCHDDGWAARDAAPSITPDGLPSAFSRDLVGTYAAFEEVGLEDYLAVRGAATEAVAARNPYAAILVSMHTTNLLTAQMDPSSLSPAGRALHAAFVDGQRRRQAGLAATLRTDATWAPFVTDSTLDRAFRFLQWCDNLSLICCSAFPKTAQLRHAHPDRLGHPVTFTCQPTNGGSAFRVSPGPFTADTLQVSIPCRTIPGPRFPDNSALRSAWSSAPLDHLTLTITQA